MMSSLSLSDVALPNPSPHETPFLQFGRAAWSELRADMQLSLTEGELAQLRSLNDPVDMREIEDIYLPLARLLHLYIDATRQLHQVTATFLSQQEPPMPYVIGVAGSVAAGKSTTARVIQALLQRGPVPRSVDLITTDGFLQPNAILQERGLMRRKGFPESYDRRRLLRFISAVKSGAPEVEVPVYSHLHYDIVEGESTKITRPDVLILEGLNVLQSSDDYPTGATRSFVSDFFDFSIYVDAEDQDLERWYIERFLKLRETAFRQPQSFFRRYGQISEAEAVETARSLWREINLANLHENILPTRERARLILSKSGNHYVHGVRLRKL